MNHSLKPTNKFKNHPHTNHTSTIMKKFPPTKNTIHLQFLTLIITMNHLFLFITMNHQPINTTKNKNHLHMLHTTTINHKLRPSRLMNQPQFNGTIISRNQLLNSTIMNLQLINITLRMNHLHLLNTITTNHLLKPTNTTNHLQLSGTTITKNQPLIFMNITQKLKNTLLNMSHLHMLHISTMNHPLNNTTHMSQPQLPGLISMLPQKNNSTPMTNTLKNTSQKMSHLHSNNTTSMLQRPQSNTSPMSQLLLLLNMINKNADHLSKFKKLSNLLQSGTTPGLHTMLLQKNNSTITM